jgi:hypothetical protein
METLNKIQAAFNVWHNGGLQTSSFYSASEDEARMDAFIERSEEQLETNSSFTLLTFTDEDEAWEEWCIYNEQS